MNNWISQLKGWLRVIFPKKYQRSPLPDEINWTLLQKKLDYRIKDKSIFTESLRHRSHPSCSSPENLTSNERLEFLGDSIVSFYIADFLFRNYPDEPEGTLTKMRAILVSRDFMAKVGKKLDIGEFLTLGEGEERTGGRKKRSIISNTIEALTGAIYLDSGYDHAGKFIEKTILEDFENTLKYEGINYKGDLLELMQKFHKPMPKFVTKRAAGPDHKRDYTVAVQVGEKTLGVGKGKSKKRAEQLASKQALDTFENDRKKLGNSNKNNSSNANPKRQDRGK
ncbi:MAG: ribonuclease III [bacterium]|nr:ribonuclease III [bacterium]